MKAKKILRRSDDFQKALKEVGKENDMRGFYANIPASYFIKLEHELVRRNLSKIEWLKEKIGEIQ